MTTIKGKRKPKRVYNKFKPAKGKNEYKQMAVIMRAIGYPTKLSICETLMTGEKYVSDLAKTCKTSLALITHHLKDLRRAGLVTSELRGTHNRYAYRLNNWKKIKKVIDIVRVIASKENR